MGPQKEDDRGPLSVQYSLPFHLSNHCRVAVIGHLSGYKVGGQHFLWSAAALNSK